VAPAESEGSHLLTGSPSAIALVSSLLVR